MRGADLVAVGVNLVVGALLVTAAIGALFIQDGRGAPSPSDLNAALGAHDDTGGNETAPSPGTDIGTAGSVPVGPEPGSAENGNGTK